MVEIEIKETIKVLEELRYETIKKDIIVGGFDKEIEALAVAIEELEKIDTNK